MMIYWACIFFGLWTTIGAQLFYKTYSGTRKPVHLTATIILFCVTIPLTFFAVKGLGIGQVYIAYSLTYLLAPVASSILLREAIPKERWGYFSMIFAGVLIYSL